jgi:hypothetical protein
MKKEYWSCACGYLHLEPHLGMVCKCGAAYSPTPSPNAPAPPIAPAPQWSTEPPRAKERPQFFWFRIGPGAKQIPVEVFEIDGEPFCNTFGQIEKLSTSRDGGEWWPVRIEPPR